MNVTDVGLVMLRVVAGGIFVAHGAQKAFGSWGGPGPSRWRGVVEGMGFAPSGPFAVISIAVELVGGLLLVVGLLTPIATAALVAQVVVIIARAHWAKGFFNTVGGFEFPLLLGVVAAVICLIGPGAVSIDAAVRFHPSLTVRVICLVVGIIAGIVAAAVPSGVAERVSRGGLRRT